MGASASSIASKFAFFPPDPSYNVETDELSGKQRLTGVPEKDKGEVLMLRTKGDNFIFTVYVKNPSASFTVLYSHGNATDLGQMFMFFTQLSDQLNVNVMGYDYSGYGRSTGEPSEQATYADIEAAYTCLTETYGVKQEDIILYGQSVGSGPTLDLAVRLPRLRAVILQSAILSGLRVMYRMKRTLRFDIYKNIEKIPLLSSPVLVIHGTEDRDVDIFHGKKLWELCKEKYEPLWIEGGKHCGLEFFPEFFRHLKKFISAIEKLQCHENELVESIDHQLKHSMNSTDLKSRLSTDHREQSRTSIGQREICRRSADTREKPRTSADRRELRSRKSVDCSGKSRNSTDQSERGRNSIDRLGDMMRSVALCNVDCFKQTREMI
ncbi:uncharacterized protein LOC132302724 [Cornus florida]|uniref:uncharacterized protein LOC132302724 n=1 Tax=Cornus florida TaxID=4283 RepID=UPI00289A548B|nr:uncharacterized protein LOC132302724 [Cornus florida]